MHTHTALSTHYRAQNNCVRAYGEGRYRSYSIGHFHADADAELGLGREAKYGYSSTPKPLPVKSNNKRPYRLSTLMQHFIRKFKRGGREN